MELVNVMAQQIGWVVLLIVPILAVILIGKRRGWPQATVVYASAGWAVAFMLVQVMVWGD